MNNSVRRITEGAMMIALMGVVLYLNLQFGGMFEVYFIWLLPIPIAIYTIRYDVSSGIITSVAAVLISFMLSTGTSFFYTITGCLCGLIYGWGVKKQKSNLTLMLSVMTVATISDFLSMIVFAAFFGYDLVAESAELVEMINTYVESANLSTASAATIVETMTKIIPTVIIVSTILSGVMEGLVTHILTNFVLKRLKFQVNALKPAGQIVPPKWLGYLCFIAAGAFLVSLRYELPTIATQICTFVGIIGFFILVGFGYVAALFTSTVYFGKKRNFIVLLLVVFMLPLSLYVLMVFGFLYICTDMRNRLLARMIEKGEENGR